MRFLQTVKTRYSVKADFNFIRQISFKEPNFTGNEYQEKTIQAFYQGKKVGELKFSIYETDTTEACPLIESLKVASEVRGVGVARALMEKAISFLWKNFPGEDIQLNAMPFDDEPLNKTQLIKFYESFGFKTYFSDGLNNNMLLRHED